MPSKEVIKDLETGEDVRRTIRQHQLKNTFVIAKMIDRGFEISETQFSRKLYGTFGNFSAEELLAINEILKPFL